MALMKAFVIISFLIIPSIVSPGTIRVPSDQPTIQEGINAASHGDTVLVADGTYTGLNNKDLDFNGKAITVKSENGPENCVIDCQDQGRGFYFHSGEGLDSIVQGFTIKNALADPGAIFCDGASPTIDGNIITQNESYHYAAGICCFAGDPVIKNNTISWNTCWSVHQWGGGGIWCFGDTVIQNNLIEHNGILGYGGGIRYYGSGTITGNTIKNNSGWAGGGIWCVGSPVITENFIIENTAFGEGTAGDGAGIFFMGSPVIMNNYIAGNSATVNGGGIFCYDATGQALVKNNLIKGNIARWSPGHGGGIYAANSTLKLINNTITENTAGVPYRARGGGIYGSNAALTITNTIFWNNDALEGGDVYLADGATLSISYSFVNNGPYGIGRDSDCNLYWGKGMAQGCPRFTTGPLGQYYLVQPPDGASPGSQKQPGGIPGGGVQHASPTFSVCVDTGDPESEMIHGTTSEDWVPDDGVIDMGYHYPTVAHAGGPYIGVVGEDIIFDASGSSELNGTITGYRWDWTGDGTWDTGWLSGQTATHRYDAPFKGAVKLEVQASGYPWYYPDKADVDVNNGEPDADAGGPYAGTIGEDITFDVSGSFDRDGTLTGCRWDWDHDGTWDTGWLTTATADHAYMTAGHGLVRLQVRDNSAQRGDDTANVIIITGEPEADAGGPYEGTVDQPVSFNANMSSDPGGTIVGYRWDWTNDGSWDTGWLSTPTTGHIYSVPFEGQVGLEVKDNWNFTDTATADVFIAYDPTADAGGPYEGRIGFPIRFDASGSFDPNGDLAGCRWDWTSDGVWDIDWPGTLVAYHTYEFEFHGQVTIEVKDYSSNTNIDTADVDVTPLQTGFDTEWLQDTH